MTQSYTMYHYPFSATSRFGRLLMAEYALEVSLIEERPWERRRDFLIMNPAGSLPLLIEGENEAIIPGCVIMAEYLDEKYGESLGSGRLLPKQTNMRIEVRRLCEWFHYKFHEEVTQLLVGEKIFKRYMRAEQGGGAPDTSAIRAGKANIRHHIDYIKWLLGKQDWLAGERMTYADLAAAAQLSCVDYLGEVPWNGNETVKAWYARIKSRPSFRPILADRVAGISPVEYYADPDF